MILPALPVYLMLVERDFGIRSNLDRLVLEIDFLFCGEELFSSLFRRSSELRYFSGIVEKSPMTWGYLMNFTAYFVLGLEGKLETPVSSTEPWELSCLRSY